MKIVNIYYMMMSGAKAPDFDTYELLRATHYHNSTQGLSPTYEQAHVGLAP